MPERVLDSNRLMQHWNRRRSLLGRLPTVDESREWARNLQDLRGSRTTVSPVVLEFLCGATKSDELHVYRSFVEEFDVLDGYSITIDDMKRAKQKAERIPRDGKPRHFADCLIRAIADRFHTDVDTADTGMPRRDSSAGQSRRSKRRK